MFEAVLSVKAPTYCPLAIPRNRHDASVFIRSLKRRGERLSHLALVSTHSSRLSFPRKFIQKYSLKPVNPYLIDRRAGLFFFETQLCPLYEALCDTPCLLIKESSHGGGAYWTVGAESKADLKYLVKHMEEYGVEASIEKIYRMNGRRVLTRRQSEALYTAYMKGYFDYPHRISLKELARHVGCSAPTLSILLRKGTRKLMEEYLSQAMGLAGQGADL
ncbi:hypothetical protein HRbin01_01075 [archaeon HR01]|nr:hypothetical protein HRbin01_01075 [archaeon HR01]